MLEACMGIYMGTIIGGTDEFHGKRTRKWNLVKDNWKHVDNLGPFSGDLHDGMDIEGIPPANMSVE